MADCKSQKTQSQNQFHHEENDNLELILHHEHDAIGCCLTAKIVNIVFGDDDTQLLCDCMTSLTFDWEGILLSRSS